MNKKQLGWSGEKCYCKLEKYLDAHEKNVWKINCGNDISVIGFETRNSAMKFAFKAGWMIIST